MKNTVLNVSDYILRYAKEKGKGLSVMQLMDYLYFVQAQVLVVKDGPAFPEALIAKDWGIFVLDVWNKYSWYGNAFIPVSDKPKNSIPNADLIEEVVDALAGKSHTSIFGIIDGRGNRGQLFKLSVGHNGCKSVLGAGNPVHVWYTRA